MTLVPSVEVRGQVTDAIGLPARGVAVEPIDADVANTPHESRSAPLPTQVITDDDGRFVVRVARPNDVHSTYAPYYFRVLDHDAILDDVAAVVAGDTSRDVAVDLARAVAYVEETPPAGATIAGRVFHDGKPLADASVMNFQGYGHDFPTRTRADGSFELGVGGGEPVSIRVDHASGLATARRIQVARGQRLDDVVIEVGNTGTIRGLVVDRTNKPVADLWIVARARDTACERRAVTSADGTFEIDAEIGHVYNVVVSPSEVADSSEGEVELDVAHPSASLRLVMPEPRLDIEVVDETGAPVEGATLFTNETTFRKLPNGGLTANYGWAPMHGSAFLFDALYARDARTDRLGHHVWAPMQRGPFSIMAIGPDGRVGEVVDVADAISSVRVTIRRPSALHVACPEALSITVVLGQGRFSMDCNDTIAGIPAGRYLLAATDGASSFASDQLVVRAGETATASLGVRARRTIHGRAVSYPDGRPLSELSCRAELPGTHEIAQDAYAKTSTDGTFAMTVGGDKIVVTCADYEHVFVWGSEQLDLSRTGSVTVRMVRDRADAFDLGVRFEVVPVGARLTRVPRSAERVGLRVGDVVREVDGASLAGLAPSSIRALAFEIPTKTSTTWTLERDGQPRLIVGSPP